MILKVFAIHAIKKKKQYQFFISGYFVLLSRDCCDTSGEINYMHFLYFKINYFFQLSGTK